MDESNFPNSCWGGRNVADVHPFRASPERTSIKLERSGNPILFLVSSLSRETCENSLSTGPLDMGRVRILIAPSYKSWKQWFPPASWKDSTSNHNASMVKWDENPAEATFLHWVSSNSGEPEKNTLGNSQNGDLFDTTEAGHRSSSFHSSSMDAGKRIWYWVRSYFKRSIQRVKTTCFFSGNRVLASNWMWSPGQHL